VGPGTGTPVPTGVRCPFLGLPFPRGTHRGPSAAFLLRACLCPGSGVLYSPGSTRVRALTNLSAPARSLRAGALFWGRGRLPFCRPPRPVASALGRSGFVCEPPLCAPPFGLGGHSPGGACLANFRLRDLPGAGGAWGDSAGGFGLLWALPLPPSSALEGKAFTSA